MLLGNEWHNKATGNLVASAKLSEDRQSIVITLHDEREPGRAASITLREVDELRSIIETLEQLEDAWWRSALEQSEASAGGPS